VDTQVAQHLAATYGDRAFSVGKGRSHLFLIFSSLLVLFGLQRNFWRVSSADADNYAYKIAVLWIRIAFNADPDTDPDPALKC
jgi:hypothetical protein